MSTPRKSRERRLFLAQISGHHVLLLELTTQYDRWMAAKSSHHKKEVRLASCPS